MRLYVHFFDARGCEAPGCGRALTSLYPRPGGLVRACCPQHATAADLRLTEEEADRISGEHFVDGEEVPELAA